MSKLGRLKGRSKILIDENKNNDELIFKQSTNDQDLMKIKELWKFLDLQCYLKPFIPLTSRKIDKKVPSCSCIYANTDEFENSEKSLCDIISNLKSTSSLYKNEDDSDKKRIWYNGLRLFQKIRLDKAILFKDKCKFCHAEKDIEKRNLDYADTVFQTYDELKREIASFEERLTKV
ncbi:hypothetical protein M0802_010703 [Mischocyttarus mexicanus]|nr:hypothetical protein M0802_010703 [Mischocyttarus mexicanus]